MRSIWDGKGQAAWPVTVVSDSAQALILYLAAGMTYKIRDFSGGLDGRMPVGEWELIDREWKSDMLRIMLPEITTPILDSGIDVNASTDGMSTLSASTRERSTESISLTTSWI